jgi:hypothetical protein
MNEVVEVLSIQRGSSNTLRTSDEQAWFVVKECWQGSRLLNARILQKCETREQALAKLTELSFGQMGRHLYRYR